MWFDHIINYNIVLYIGIALIVGGFILFLVATHFQRQAEIKLFRLQQLEKAYWEAKKNEHI
jgi:hypothetical protein|tara:strand:+ start:341 stop:523 length:183 start_codon:yes stop_codon:yes gene_type:complete